MPDLSHEAIQLWLDRHGSNAIDADTQTPGPHDDHPDVLPGLLHFGLVLDNARDANPALTSDALGTVQHAPNLAVVLAHLSGGRRLRLLTWLQEVPPDGTPKVIDKLMAVADAQAGAALRQWILRMHRLDLLGRLFAPERLDALLIACRSTNNQDHTS